MGLKLPPDVEAKVYELAGRPFADLPEGISEADFRWEVVRLARLLGWRVAAIRPVRVQRANGSIYYETPMEADGCGWPDLFLCRDDTALAIELKTGRNKPTGEQQKWITALRAAGIQAQVFYPADWQTIQKVLGRKP